MNPNSSRPAVARSNARVTDDDRTRAVLVLGDAFARGSLDAAEYEQRVGRAWRSRRAVELADLTDDLPAPSEAEVARGRRDSDMREWLQEWRWWLGGAVILSAVWGVQAIRTGPDFFWPLVPLGIWAAVLIAVAIWPRDQSS